MPEGRLTILRFAERSLFVSSKPRSGRSSGQVLVLVAGGMLAFIAMVGLVVDGGHAWGRQRITQNGVDAIAEAGTTVIAQNVAGTNPKKTDGDVGCAVAAAAAANGIAGVQAAYTDWQGELLTTGEQVGPCAAGFGAVVPVCDVGELQPCDAGGVKATGSQTFDTFLIRAIGATTLSASADATAITGTLSGCPEGVTCPLVPITIAISQDTCDGSGKVVVGSSLWPIVDPAAANASNESNVALCKNGPGGFAGLDLGGPGCNTNDRFTPACEASVPIPAWVPISTGSVKNDIDPGPGQGLNQYAGPTIGVADDQIVLVPMHDNTCFSDPPDTTPAPCSDGDWSGVGNNTYYHVPYFTGFMIDQAYKQNEPCNQAPGQPINWGDGNSSDACLKGWFVKLVLNGPVGGQASGDPQDPASIGVQLIN
jgi:hypothetical protein